MRAGSTDVAGRSGTPGANLPVTDIEQASNTIQGARADLARTAGAERRLDGFDGVGGDGGGMGDKADAGQANADNATGAVAQGTADLNVSDQQGGIGAERVMGEQAVDPAGAQTDPRSAVVYREGDEAMPMMIESQFLSLTHRAAVQWTREFQQHINNAVDTFRDHLRSTANTALLTDGNSASNVTKAAGPMGPAAT